MSNDDPAAAAQKTAPTTRRLADLVRRAREKRGWSQVVLAETARVDHNVISRLELGQYDPPFSLAADLVRILNIPIEDAVYSRSVRPIREDPALGDGSSRTA